MAFSSPRCCHRTDRVFDSLHLEQGPIHPATDRLGSIAYYRARVRVPVLRMVLHQATEASEGLGCVRGEQAVMKSAGAGDIGYTLAPRPNISLQTDTDSCQKLCMPAQGGRQQSFRQVWRKRQTIGAAELRR